MSNFMFRTVKMDDLDDVFELIKSNSGGMSSLLSSKGNIKRQIKRSTSSFKKKTDFLENEKYLFVLEELDLRKIIGISGIEAVVGCEHPFYVYKIDREHVLNSQLNLAYDRETISLVNDYTNVSELCSLFLDRNYRKFGLGSYLSRIRFLFIRIFPERFFNKVVADLRGVIDADGGSPFWQSLGKKFFDIEYNEAIQKISSANYYPLADILPKHPIYLNFLSKEAINVIGKTHINTKPVLDILSSEGFTYYNYVNVFDAGPIVECQKNKIKTIKKVKECYVTGQKDKLTTDKKKLVANMRLDFKAMLSNVDFINNKEVILPKKILKAMQLKIGDQILIL